MSLFTELTDEQRALLPSTLTKDQQAELRKQFDQSHSRDLVESAYRPKGKQSSYARKMVELYGSTWWDEVSKDMQSNDPMTKKVAIQEFNKLQMRTMPVELSGPDGEDLVINVIDYTRRSIIGADSLKYENAIDAETTSTDETEGDNNTV